MPPGGREGAPRGWAVDGHFRSLTLKLRKGQVQGSGGGSCYRRAHTRMCTRTRVYPCVHTRACVEQCRASWRHAVASQNFRDVPPALSLSCCPEAVGPVGPSSRNRTQMFKLNRGNDVIYQAATCSFLWTMHLPGLPGCLWPRDSGHRCLYGKDKTLGEPVLPRRTDAWTPMGQTAARPSRGHRAVNPKGGGSSDAPRGPGDRERWRPDTAWPRRAAVCRGQGAAAAGGTGV